MVTVREGTRRNYRACDDRLGRQPPIQVPRNDCRHEDTRYGAAGNESCLDCGAWRTDRQHHATWVAGKGRYVTTAEGVWRWDD